MALSAARGPIRLRPLLLPVVQGAERDLVARRQLLLRQSQRPPQILDTRHAPQAREMPFGKRLGVGIAGRRLGLRVGHSP